MTTLLIQACSSSQPTVYTEANLAAAASRLRCSSCTSSCNLQCTRASSSFLKLRCACGLARVSRSGLDEVDGGRMGRP